MSIPPTGAPTTGYAPQYQYPTYLLRRKMLQLLGGRIDIYGPGGIPVLCCLQKAFKLKEDVRLYTDDTKTKELICIKARSIIDFSSAYDVTDSQTGEQIGVLRRRGVKSIIRDTWEILDASEKLVAIIEEDNMLLALVRRFLTNLIPQSYHYTTPTGQEIAKAHQHFNPFIHKMDLIMPTGAVKLDPRLVLASTTLLVLIEGRQQ